MFAETQGHTLRREFAGKFDAQEIAVRIGEGFAVVLIKGAVTIFAGIDTKSQRASGSFYGTLSDRLHGQDGTFANVDGKSFEFGLDQHIGRQRSFSAGAGGLNFFAGPVVVPKAGRQSQGVAVGLLGKWRWSNEEVGTKEKFVAGIEIERVRIGSGVGKFEEERPDNGQTGTRKFFGGGVEIGEKAIALFDIAAADIFLFGAVDPNFLVTGTFVGVVAIDGLEAGKFRPEGEQVPAWECR